jgi:hypothetical protein
MLRLHPMHMQGDLMNEPPSPPTPESRHNTLKSSLIHLFPNMPGC